MLLRCILELRIVEYNTVVHIPIEETFTYSMKWDNIHHVGADKIKFHL